MGGQKKKKSKNTRKKKKNNVGGEHGALSHTDTDAEKHPTVDDQPTCSEPPRNALKTSMPSSLQNSTNHKENASPRKDNNHSETVGRIDFDAPVRRKYGIQANFANPPKFTGAEESSFAEPYESSTDYTDYTKRLEQLYDIGPHNINELRSFLEAGPVDVPIYPAKAQEPPVDDTHYLVPGFVEMDDIIEEVEDDDDDDHSTGHAVILSQNHCANGGKLNNILKVADGINITKSDPELVNLIRQTNGNASTTKEEKVNQVSDVNEEKVGEKQRRKTKKTSAKGQKRSKKISVEKKAGKRKKTLEQIPEEDNKELSTLGDNNGKCRADGGKCVGKSGVCNEIPENDFLRQVRLRTSVPIRDDTALNYADKKPFSSVECLNVMSAENPLFEQSRRLSDNVTDLIAINQNDDLHEPKTSGLCHRSRTKSDSDDPSVSYPPLSIPHNRILHYYDSKERLVDWELDKELEKLGNQRGSSFSSRRSSTSSESEAEKRRVAYMTGRMESVRQFLDKPWHKKPYSLAEPQRLDNTDYITRNSILSLCPDAADEVEDRDEPESERKVSENDAEDDYWTELWKKEQQNHRPAKPVDDRTRVLLPFLNRELELYKLHEEHTRIREEQQKPATSQSNADLDAAFDRHVRIEAPPENASKSSSLDIQKPLKLLKQTRKWMGRKLRMRKAKVDAAGRAASAVAAKCDQLVADGDGLAVGTRNGSQGSHRLSACRASDSASYNSELSDEDSSEFETDTEATSSRPPSSEGIVFAKIEPKRRMSSTHKDSMDRSSNGDRQPKIEARYGIQLAPEKPIDVVHFNSNLPRFVLRFSSGERLVMAPLLNYLSHSLSVLYDRQYTHVQIDPTFSIKEGIILEQFVNGMCFYYPGVLKQNAEKSELWWQEWMRYNAKEAVFIAKYIESNSVIRAANFAVYLNIPSMRAWCIRVLILRCKHMNLVELREFLHEDAVLDAHQESVFGDRNDEDI